MTVKALTANRLDDGRVVFFTPDGDWSPAIDRAALASGPAAEELFEAEAARALAANLVADAYLFEVERIDGHIRPVHIRERIRTLGPTVHPDHGKQAEGTGGRFPALD